MNPLINIGSSKIVVDFLIKESVDIHRHKCITDNNYRGYNTDRFTEFMQKSGYNVGTYASLYKLRDRTYSALTYMWNQDDLTAVVNQLQSKSLKYSILLSHLKGLKCNFLESQVMMIPIETIEKKIIYKENLQQIAVECNANRIEWLNPWCGMSELDAKVGTEYPLKGGCKDSNYVLFPIERLDILGKMDYVYRVTVSHVDNLDQKDDFFYLLKNNVCWGKYRLSYDFKDNGYSHNGIKALKIYGTYENHTKESKSIVLRFGSGSDFPRQKYIDFDYEFLLPPNTKGVFYFFESVYVLFEKYLEEGEYIFDISSVDIEFRVPPGIEYVFQVDSVIEMKKNEEYVRERVQVNNVLWYWCDLEISKSIGFTDCNKRECNDIYESFGDTLDLLDRYEEVSGIYELSVCCSECDINDNVWDVTTYRYQGEVINIYETIDNDRNIKYDDTKGKVKRKYFGQISSSTLTGYGDKLDNG